MKRQNINILEAIELYKIKRKTLKEISILYNVSISTLKRMFSKNRVFIKENIGSSNNVNINEAIFLYQNGQTLEDIGLKYGVSYRTISRLFLKNSIHIRNRSENSIGERNNSFKNQKTITKDGYIKIWVNGERVWEHRYIIEQYIGRKLEKWEIVHHINGNKQDNRIENLKIVTNKTHRKEHVISSWSRKYDSCINCGTTERKHAGHGLCTKCNQYFFEVNKRGYECEYINGKRIFSENHKNNLKKSAILRYNKEKT